MKHTLLFAFLIFFGMTTTNANDKLPTADAIETGHGLLIVQPVQHGTLVLTYNNKTIYVDPTGGKEAFEGLAKPDLILITDIHGDHYDIETIKALDAQDAIIIAPKVVYDELPSTYKRKAVDLKNRQGIHRLDFFISAVAMYNVPESENAYHTKGRGNGYIINIEDFNIYISGDTSVTQEMKMLTDINVAFVCMNLPWTMDVQEASEGVLAFQPEIVYPYHYRGKTEMSDTTEFKRLVNTQNNSIEVRLRDWYSQ